MDLFRNSHITQSPNVNTVSDPHHEYLDIQIVHNNTNNKQPIPVSFNQIKTENIVDNSEDYYLSVIRWNLDSALPVIIPEMQLATTQTAYTGNTNYILNIIVGTSPATAPQLAITSRRVILVSDNALSSTPAYQPMQITDYYGSSYYHINSIMSFLNMVNKALSDSFTALVAQYGSMAEFPPKFVWNNDRIELIFDKPFILYDDVVNKIFITMNTELYYLFNSFSAKKIGSTVSSNTVGCDYAIMIYNNYSIDSYSDKPFSNQTLKDLYVLYGEQSSVVNWSPVSSIYFATHAIPVNSSMSGAPQFSGQIVETTGNTTSQDVVLTDFQIALNTGLEWQGQLYYQPSAEYRLFDLIGTTPLRNLNLNVYWKSKLGVSYPFLMNYGASCSIKIMFRKKSYNNI